MLAQLGLIDDNDLASSEEYTVAIDIWSLGEIAFRALTGEQPFPTMKSLATYIKGTSSFPVDVLHAQGVGSEGSDILKSLMAPIPNDRLTAKEALRHKWVDPQNPSSGRSSREMERYLFLITPGNLLSGRY